MSHRILKKESLLVALLAFGACNTLGGIEEPVLDNNVGGGNGGSGGGGATFCQPGEKRPCYTGPQATRGIGQCKEGQETCLADGSAFGSCEGEVMPAAAEDCMAVGDEDCNGLDNNYPACPCTPGQSVGCDSGQPGVCAQGGGLCLSNGTIDECKPLKMPSFDACFTPEDEDCDGTAINQCTGTPQASLDITGQTNTNRVRGLAATPDNGYVAVGSLNADPSIGLFLETAGTAFVVRVAPDGKTIAWQKSFPATVFSSAMSVAVDKDGDVIVAGYYNGTLDLGDGQTAPAGGDLDAFVLKLAGADGALVWSKPYALPWNQSALAVTADENKNVIITGATADISLTTSSATAQKDHILLAKLTPDGVEEWNKVFENQGMQKGRSVITLPGGDIVIAGDSTGAIKFANGWVLNDDKTDIFWARFKSTGAHVWSHQDGGVEQNYARKLAVAKNGNLLLTGLFETFIAIQGQTMAAFTATPTSESAFLAEFNVTNGNLVRILPTGNVGHTGVSDIAVDATGDIVISGVTDNTITWGGTSSQKSTGANDAFAVKIAWGDPWQPRWIKMLTGVDDQRADAIAVDGLGRVIVGGWFNKEIIYGGFVPDGASGEIGLFAVRLDP